jgi:hypothetical protein
LHPKPYLGYKFEIALKTISNFKDEDEKTSRHRCIHFIIEFLK